MDYHVNWDLGKSTAMFQDSKGRTLSDSIYTLKTKYRLIFTIVKHLNGEFKKIKEYILQLISNMHDEIKILIDIQDFQKKIAEAFEAKGLLSSYKNDILPAPKKSMSVNEAKIDMKIDKKDKKDREDSPAGVKAFNDEFRKEKVSAAKDLAIKNEVTALATKLAEYPANKVAKVGLHKDIQALLKQKKVRVCWCCRSSNCLLRQDLSFKNKIKKRFSFSCKEKQISFEELPAQIKESKTDSNTASANVKPPVIDSYDSDSANIDGIFTDMDKLQNERN